MKNTIFNSNEKIIYFLLNLDKKIYSLLVVDVVVVVVLVEA